MERCTKQWVEWWEVKQHYTLCAHVCVRIFVCGLVIFCKFDWLINKQAHINKYINKQTNTNKQTRIAWGHALSWLHQTCSLTLFSFISLILQKIREQVIISKEIPTRCFLNSKSILFSLSVLFRASHKCGDHKHNHASLINIWHDGKSCPSCIWGLLPHAAHFVSMWGGHCPCSEKSKLLLVTPDDCGLQVLLSPP